MRIILFICQINQMQSTEMKMYFVTFL